MESRQVQAGSAKSAGEYRRRNRLYFLAGAVLVLAIGGTYAWSVISALAIRAATGAEFATYVVKHHIGKASITSDSSGVQSDFCVLQLNQPIPDAQLSSQAFQLMQTYHNLDGGDTLTIQYRAQSHTRVEASVYYNSSAQTVTMDLQRTDGRAVVERHVQWTSNTYGD